mgnify:CR=1 FL=1
MARKEGRFNALADKVPSSDKDKTVTYVTTEKQYHVALYARLSVEKDGRKSDSIESQFMIMENFIKESKDEFGFTEMSSHLMTTNANRLQVAALAYNIFNAFRRLCLPKKLGKLRANAIRLHFLKIASRKVVAGRKVIFKFCSSYPHIQEFYDVFHRIGKLVPQME